jgi:NADH:ubiquinone oxidoreductase subunit 2 (subunit N)
LSSLKNNLIFLTFFLILSSIIDLFIYLRARVGLLFTKKTKIIWKKTTTKKM